MDMKLIKEYVKKKLGNLKIKELNYFDDMISFNFNFNNKNYNFELYKSKINNIEKYILKKIIWYKLKELENPDKVYFESVQYDENEDLFRIEYAVEHISGAYAVSAVYYKNYKIKNRPELEKKLNEITYKFENIIKHKIWINN